MEEDFVRARVRVCGRVQGVWFRQATADAARQAGVTGWVRNLPDGSVEAVFEGSRAAVDRAIDFASVGPPRAHVESAEVTWEPPAGESGFAIRG
ncbi:MAG TPA: acylphosphatase [Coriobacteriia bacterium]